MELVTSAYLNNGPAGVVKPAYHDNLYWVRYENYETDERTRYFGNVNLNYKINSFLNVMGRVSLDNWNQLIETRYAVGSAVPRAIQGPILLLQRPTTIS